MREIKPYKTLKALASAIDNGGRFYHMFTRADDRVVSAGELAKAAGVYGCNTHAFLFFDMAQQDLSSGEQAEVVGMLEPKLRREYQRRRAKTMQPSVVDAEGKAGEAVLLTGYPRFIKNKTAFNGFIMIPIQSGSATTFTMIPIFDQFDVYELFDDARMRKPCAIVTSRRGKRFAADGPVRFGGVLRKLQFEKKAERTHELYLETVYFTRL